MTEQKANIRDIMQAFAESVLRGERAALATVVKSQGGPPLEAKMMVTAQGQTLSTLGDTPLEAQIIQDCLAAIEDGQPKMVHLTLEEKPQALVELFIEVAVPCPSLLIIGAGHVGQSMSQMGKLLGFRVVVVDDRPDYANVQRFPEADEIIAADFIETLRNYPITDTTYAVLVTRGHRYDEQSLRQILNSSAAYIGMIGSHRRVATILRHLAEEGYPPERLRQIYSPIGLDIGAETPEEIALSIMAEIVNVMRDGRSQSLAIRSW
ncbi:XdhC family protein [Chloroflexota bacterium]